MPTPADAQQPASAPPSKQLLSEAADWLMRLHFAQPTPADQEAFTQWLAQSPAHAAAWQKAQKVMRTFAPLQNKTGNVGQQALKHLASDTQRQSQQTRRRNLQLLGMLMLAGPTGWLAWQQLPWRQWNADIATATGERRTEQLPDGSEIILNTDTAINIAFNASERRLRLVSGEILVTTHADLATQPRPFIVETPQGNVQALGTRFTVRTLGDATTRVAVLEHAVRIELHHGPTQVLQAGEQTDFTRTSIHASTVAEPTSTLWQNGMLLAQNMRLDAAIAEMARYRPGVLQCDPAIGHLRISGSISLDDTDAGLALLEHTLPVRIARRTRYWVTVVPR